jgi:1L-myo-inositol 1-phosphate cytidylyltransferase
MEKNTINKGVILAAGDGGRLGELTSWTPKVLLPVLGKPLILYPINALISAGIREIAIVVGHFSDKVEEFLEKYPVSEANVQFIYNRDHQGGNAISVRAGGDWADGEPFVLCMGDHIISPEYVSRFLNYSRRRETLGVDFKPGNHHIIEEATKVQIDEKGHILDIGKELAWWDCIDTGVFLLTSSFVSAIKELTRTRGINIEISEVIRFMLGRGQEFATSDISGSFWADIDTAEDIKMVKAADR